MLREQAHAQRVKEQQLATEQQAGPLNTPMSFPDFEVDLYPDMDIGSLWGTPIISQDDEEDTNHPTANTQHQRQICTLTQDYMLHMMEISPGYTTPFSPQQVVSQTFPLQFLCDLAHAVPDDDTGDLLEYRHLIKHPKYKGARGVTHSERKSDD